MGDEYLPRIADDLLEERLGYAGGVLIRGAKWCGKTRTAEQHAKSALYLQDPDTRVSNLDLAQTKPSVLLRGPKPRLIDEWQDAPQLWDAARFAIDRTHEHGQFIFSGSAPLASGKDTRLGYSNKTLCGSVPRCGGAWCLPWHASVRHADAWTPV